MLYLYMINKAKNYKLLYVDSYNTRAQAESMVLKILKESRCSCYISESADLDGVSVLNVWSREQADRDSDYNPVIPWKGRTRVLKNCMYKNKSYENIYLFRFRSIFDGKFYYNITCNGANMNDYKNLKELFSYIKKFY